jgi:hypothetical protein
MPTALEMIRRSMRLINVLAAGEAPVAQEQNDGLTTLNAMLDSWSINKLNVYALQEDTHTLVAGTATYTIGSGATINTDRPLEIQRAFVRRGTVDYPLDIIGDKYYAEVPDKTVTGTPEELYYNPLYPNGSITLFPVPDVAYTLHIYQWEQLQSFTSLTTSLSLPPGYENAIVYNLAVDMAPEYGVEAPSLVMRLASKYLGDVKRKNKKPIYAGTEVVSLSDSKGTRSFNITKGY